MTPADEKYVALTTFTTTGQRKSTPVWIAAIGGEVGFTTGTDAWKLKRLRNDPRCELQPCDARGRVREGAIVVTGRAREASPEEYTRVKRAIEQKYGLVTKVIGIPNRIKGLFGRGSATADTAVVIVLD